MSNINRAFLFDHVRQQLFGGKLKQSQVDGHNSLLDYWEGKHAPKDDRWLAYALATAFHETAHTLQPVTELGSVAYKTDRYDVSGSNPARAKKMGNTTPGDGVKYAGRGYIQLTWKNNYQTASKAVGVDLVGSPEAALQPAVAAAVLYEGMIAGWFTGKRLSDYFSGDTANWTQARRIVNGLDKADMIATYGKTYYAAISYTT